MTLPIPNDAPVSVPTTASSTDSKEQAPGKRAEAFVENEGGGAQVMLNRPSTVCVVHVH